MECSFDTTDQRATIGRKQSHGEPGTVRCRGYASKTTAAIRRCLDLRDISQLTRWGDHENRTGCGHSANRTAVLSQMLATNAATVKDHPPPGGPYDAGIGRKLRKCSPATMRVVRRKALRHDEDCTLCDSCDGSDVETAVGKKDVRIRNNGTKSTVLHRHRIMHRRTNPSPVMHDGRRLSGEVERGTGADDQIEFQPIAGVKPTRGRLKIEGREIGSHPVELECTRHMKRIADMLPAEHGFAASQFRNQQSFCFAARLKPERGRRQG